MDCNEDSDREIAKRTIALLLSFAVMAQGLATRSYFVRCYMLWILRRAEASAWRFVYGPNGAPSRHFTLHRNSPADALRLAETFRQLAQALKDELRQDQHFTSWWQGGINSTAHEMAELPAALRFQDGSGFRSSRGEKGGVREPKRSVLEYVSIGSAEHRRLQAGFT